MAIDTLVVNLTRLGDLLQCQAVIDDLDASGHSVGLICLENFVAAAAMLRGVKKVWPLRGANLLALSRTSWQEACRNLLTFVRKVRDEAKQKRTLNLTPAAPARLLTWMLSRDGAEQAGFGIDNFGYGLNLGAWASFFSSAARKRANATFNVADMYRGLALPITGGFEGESRLAKPADRDLAKARELLAAASDPKKIVALQLGASEERRRWPAESFAILGDRLFRETGHTPVLLGSPNEKPLAQAYAAVARESFIDLVGKTSLPELAAVLSASRALVTNDTGTMHLAAGLGVPTLAFFLASAQPMDTGPSLPGCLAIEPLISCQPCAFNAVCERNFACRHVISPESAFDLIRGWLASGSWNEGVTERVKRECRLWLTETDATGLTRPRLLGAPKESQDAWLAWLREFWLPLLAALSGKPASSDFANLPKPPKALAKNAAETLDRAADLIASIIASGELAKKNRAGGQIFLRNCERLQTMLTACPPLDSLAGFWRELRQNQGESLEKFLPLAAMLGKRAREFATALKATV